MLFTYIQLLIDCENFCRDVGKDDISVKITHCGICYADVLLTRNKFGKSLYPVVPGCVIVKE
jgi:cinnamyl-alcohol dehydrogenase